MAAQDKLAPKLAIPLPKSGNGSQGYWHTQLEQSKKNLDQIRKKYKWNLNVERYTLSRDTVTLQSGSAVLLPKDYSYCEQKLALLFFQTPEVVLTPARPDVSTDTALLFQAVLNDLVSPGKLNAKATVDEVLRDVLVPAGVGIATIGYEAFVDPEQPTVPMQVGEEPALDELGQPRLTPAGPPTIDPLTGLMAPPPMRPVMQPIMEEVPNVVAERKFLERVSPLDFLWPTGFRGSDWAKASWLATRSRVPSSVAEQVYGVTAEFLKSYRESSGKQPTETDSLSPDKTTQFLDGIEVISVWYRAIDVDDTIGDPDLIRWLVLFDGQIPIKHKDSPYQTIENGRVVSGLRRAPIYPLTTRYAADTPIPPSDCAMSRVITDELSKSRTQMIEQRDRNVPMRTIAIDKLTPDSRDKFLRGQTQEVIAVEGLQPTERAIEAIQAASFPDENFNFNNYLERDLQEAWGLGSQNLGQTGTSGRTATELSIANAATDTRMESERVRVLQWWTSIVEGLAVLVQRYDDDTRYVHVLGPDGAKNLTAWTRQDIQGEYAFHIRPDSARRVDQAAERKFRVDVFNLLANDPTLNRQELIRWMAPTLGLDPEKLFLPPQPPKKEDPRVSVSLSVKGEDLLIPQVQTILHAQGILPAPPAAPSAPTGGAQPGMAESIGRVPPVNQHAADQTGRLDGNGSATTRSS